MIRIQQLPPKPVLSIDMDEYRAMQKLMIKVQDEAAAIRRLQDVELPNLKSQLAETKGLFKSKERKVKSNQAHDRQFPPPEKQSVRNKLRQLQAESKQRRTHNRHSQDRER